MPTRIFDWIARTAMLAMAGLVTLSILGSIAAMTNDPGTGFAPRGLPPVEGDRTTEPEAGQATVPAGEGNAAAPRSAGPQATTTVVAAPPAQDDEAARWLEAIAYALLALAGVGAIAVLMLWRAVRELRRIADRPMR